MEFFLIIFPGILKFFCNTRLREKRNIAPVSLLDSHY
jgi:hypothetical protein